MDWGKISDWNDLAGTISSLTTALAIIVGAGWFLYTRQYLRRVQFDIDCEFFRLSSTPDVVVAEIKFIIENKGIVKHYLYNLYVSVHGLSSDSKLKIDDTQELVFDRKLIRRVNIVPQNDYYFVRPSVRQVITHIVKLESPGSVVRITAGFYYQKLNKEPSSESNVTPQTARRVFKIPEDIDLKAAPNNSFNRSAS